MTLPIRRFHQGLHRFTVRVVGNPFCSFGFFLPGSAARNRSLDGLRPLLVPPLFFVVLLPAINV